MVDSGIVWDTLVQVVDKSIKDALVRINEIIKNLKGTVRERKKR